MLNKKPSCMLNNYHILKNLGSGYNSKVKLGVHKDTKKEYAIKIMKDNGNNQSNLRASNNENKTLLELNHSGIIKLYEVGDKGVYTKSSTKIKNDITYAV